MVDFIAEFACGAIELVIDLLFEPWVGKRIENRKQKKQERYQQEK